MTLLWNERMNPRTVLSVFKLAKGTPKNSFQFYIPLYYCLPKMSLHLGEVFGQDQQHLQTLRTTAATLRPHQPLHPQLNLNLN